MLPKLTTSEVRRTRQCPVECDIVKQRVASLSDFFGLIDDLTSEDRYWYRGHPDLSWELVPSALRYGSEELRRTALKLLHEFRRIAEQKIPRPPPRTEELEWVQVAQHYGLPTRLLDWTESATVGLYFACLGHPKADAVLFVLDPVRLNALGPAKMARVLTAQEDGELIDEYLALEARSSGKRGKHVLAISPVWNSERLILQRGAFTLHGSRFELDRAQAPSLVGIPILKEHKPVLLRQLARIGVDRLTLFPEIEHACTHLKERLAE